LSSASPATDYQTFIYAVGALIQQQGIDAATATIELAADAAFVPSRDGPALRQFVAAIAGRQFDTDSALPQLTLPTITNNHLPADYPLTGQVAAAVRAPLASRRVGTNRTMPYSRSANVGGPAPSPSSQQIDFRYINGIKTYPWQAALSQHRLALIVHAVPGLDDGQRFRVRLSYNASAVENAPGDVACNPYDGLYIDASGRVVNRATGQVCLEDNDYIESAFLGLATYVSSPVPPLAAAIRDSINDAWSHSRNTVLIPHSQGNFYARQAVELLRDAARLPTGADSLCLGAIPLASPIASPWYLGFEFLQPVQLDGDIITSFPVSHFPSLPSAMYSSGLAEIALRYPVVGVPPVVQAVNLLSSQTATEVLRLRMHFLDTSYLSPDGGLSYVTGAIASVADACSRRVAISPDEQLLQVGGSVQLQATVVTANGASRTQPGAFQWTSSDTAVAVVSTSGVVSAVRPGQAIVTAYSFGERAEANIRVDSPTPGVLPPVVTASASETDESHFFTQYTGYINWKVRTISLDVASPDSTTEIEVQDVSVNPRSYGNALGMDTSPGFSSTATHFTGTYRVFHSPRVGQKALMILGSDVTWSLDRYIQIKVRTKTAAGSFYTWHLSVQVPGA
jgi:hypothetical protein